MSGHAENVQKVLGADKGFNPGGTEDPEAGNRAPFRSSACLIYHHHSLALIPLVAPLPGVLNVEVVCAQLRLDQRLHVGVILLSGIQRDRPRGEGDVVVARCAPFRVDLIELHDLHRGDEHPKKFRGVFHGDLRGDTWLR